MSLKENLKEMNDCECPYIDIGCENSLKGTICLLREHKNCKYFKTSTEKQILEVLDYGLDALIERREVDYILAKEIRELLKQDKIIIQIKE